MIFLMFLSVLGYSLSGRLGNQSEAETLVYNGYEFVPRGSYWNLNIQGFDFYFAFSPEATENASVYTSGEIRSLNEYSGLPLYIQSESSAASAEIYTNLNQIVERMQNACIDEDNCEDNVPVKDCTSNFIIIEEDDSLSIEQDENCVYIRGEQEELVKVTDEFLYKILGIKE